MIDKFHRIHDIGSFAASAVNVVNDAGSQTSSSLVRIIVDPSTPRGLLLELKRLMMPTSDQATLIVDELGDPRPTESSCDLLIIASGGADLAAVASAASSASANGVAVIIVAQSALDAPDGQSLSCTKGTVSLVVAAQPGTLERSLASCISDTCSGIVRLSRAYSFLRSAAAKTVVSNCAAKNATVGALPLGRVTGMPTMSGNQTQMAIDIARAYGANGRAAYLASVAVVLAAGYGWRAVARALDKDRGFSARFVNAGIAYAGTIVSGLAVRAVNEVIGWRRNS